jgi:hypothetical protein
MATETRDELIREILQLRDSLGLEALNHIDAHLDAPIEDLRQERDNLKARSEAQ